ncbi:DinB family protein [Ornithinibacillus salinisoli]|uniref:DinB family protein n=1 Tax=Ornithinibacillus salinisoli TaxID=1848459 RepID=A0ABW4W1T4_9BACI
MDVNGFIYAAKQTNVLAKATPVRKWDDQLIPEIGSLRKLFIHIVRVRDVYRDGLRTGVIHFPGKLLRTNRLVEELERSMEDLANEFRQTKFETIKIGTECLTILELQGTAIQHEGIHQGQYSVALKQAGISLPKQWVEDWNM